jgi:phosphohistidine phosphatase SixA
MRKNILLILILFSAISMFSQEQITTYYLIRHAEKERTNTENSNPKLNQEGLKRAKKWSKIFSNVDFDAVYSTAYARTIETATPTAQGLNLEIQIYNPQKLYDAKFQKDTKGQTVLIVGHSNTTPLFVNKIIKEEKYNPMNDENNSNLYITTVTKDLRTCVLLKID